jgi:hypothetical protein
MKRFFRRNNLIVFIFIILLGFSPTGRGAVSAAPVAFWSAPQVIPGLNDPSPSQYPIFIADPTGSTHILHSQWVGDNFSIVYAQWTVGVGWSQPVDVFFFPLGQARITSAFLGEDGMLKVMFWGGDDNAANIFIVQAPLHSAGKATAWSKPILVGEHAISPTTGTMINAGDGRILIVYSGNESGNGLYSVVSSNNGETWSPPNPFYLAGSETLWPSELRLTQSEDGRVHAVWGLGDMTGNSQAVFYSAYDFAQADWSNPVILDRAIGFEADTPNIIEHDGTLMVVYHNNFPTTRWMIRSFDGGNTWTKPDRLFEQVGTNGYADFAVDSNRRLHMFFGNRVSGNPDIHGLWHSIWMGERWSTPEAIISGSLNVGDDDGEEGFDPSFAQAIISQGNLALVAWRHDPQAHPTHVWYSYTYLDAPRLPTEAPIWLTAPAPLPTPDQVPVTSPTSLPPAFTGDGPYTQDGSQIAFTLTLVISPALVLVLAVLILKRKVR